MCRFGSAQFKLCGEEMFCVVHQIQVTGENGLFFSGHQCVVMNSDRPLPLLVKEDKIMELKWRKRGRKLMVESKTDGLKEKQAQKKLE